MIELADVFRPFAEPHLNEPRSSNGFSAPASRRRNSLIRFPRVGIDGRRGSDLENVGISSGYLDKCCCFVK